MMLNADTEVDFEVDESSEATLNIQHVATDGPNRTKLTTQTISSTSFAAKLNLVQYEQWKGEEAVLLGFSFEFRFPNDSLKRVTNAVIRLTLQATRDATLAEPEKPNPRNDPQVLLLSPAQVRGSIVQETITRKWQVKVPVKYSFFGATAGIEGSIGQMSKADAERVARIDGFSDSDDDHHDDNAVVWTVRENAAQKSGIPHRFPAAIVAKLPKDPMLPVKLTARVVPSVAFSLNPIRLKQKKDAPVYLDRVSEKGQTVGVGIDFANADFPWHEVVSIPDEYSDSLTV